MFKVAVALRPRLVRASNVQQSRTLDQKIWRFNEFKTFGCRLNGLNSEIAAFVDKSDFVKTNEGREVCTKLISSVQMTISNQQEATGHLVGDQARHFEEWSKRERALKIQHEEKLERVVLQLTFEKNRELDTLRGTLMIEKKRLFEHLKDANLLRRGQKLYIYKMRTYILRSMLYAVVRGRLPDV